MAEGQYIYRSERARNLLVEHLRLFRLLFDAVRKIAGLVQRVGGYIAMEWPRQCSYWLDPDVQQFVWEHGLQSVHLDGCMFGLVAQHGSRSGVPIKKPWRIDTNSPALLQHVARTCDGSHEHTPCAGSDTKLTEGYTDELVAHVHEAFAVQCRLRQQN